MAISRLVRESLLQSLGAFMRGEINNDQFDEQREICVDECRKNGDESAANVGFVLWCFYDDCVTHKISQSPEGWNALRRFAAFLKTDFELERIVRRQKHARQLLGFLGLPSLGIGWLLLTQTGSWAPLVVLWAVIAVAWGIMRRREPRKKEFEVMWQHAPFWSEKQWRRYEPLIEELGLPSYNPAVHNRPYRSKASNRVIWIQNTACGIAFLPIVLLWNCFSIKCEVYMITVRE